MQLDSDGNPSQFIFTVGEGEHGNFSDQHQRTSFQHNHTSSGERQICKFFLFNKDGCMFSDRWCKQIHDHELREKILNSPRPPCPFHYSEFFPGVKHRKCKFGAGGCWYSHNCEWRKKETLTALDRENSLMKLQIKQLTEQNDTDKAKMVTKLCKLIIAFACIDSTETGKQPSQSQSSQTGESHTEKSKQNQETNTKSLKENSVKVIRQLPEWFPQGPFQCAKCSGLLSDELQKNIQCIFSNHSFGFYRRHESSHLCGQCLSTYVFERETYGQYDPT
mmetsp:Transcript_8979/g.11907  ORF Transcript_8979/g.11907 Transcript_8979/m.11907 type:complete len:277 (+) Transcript_8979:85-915(+)